jgi:hypothetical protein
MSSISIMQDTMVKDLVEDIMMEENLAADTTS